jgi:type III secretion protein L
MPHCEAIFSDEAVFVSMTCRLRSESGGLTGWQKIMTEEVENPGARSNRAFPLSSPKILKRGAYEATREAQDVVGQAHAKASQIIEQAERESDAIRRLAEQDGHAQGLAEWNQILARTSQRADELVKNWERDMLRLSVRVAEKIIGEELRVRPDAIASIVREVLKGARPGKQLTLQVNAADAEQVRANLDRIRERTTNHSEIDVVTSALVLPGGCIVESELGVIDARLETQLKCLEEVLVRSVSGD